MNIAELKDSGLIIFEHVRGSHMYGTNTEKSDIDIGGLFIHPNNAWLSMFTPSKEIKDEKGDTAYFELRRYLDLACSANPTVLETMFCPDDCVMIRKPVFDILLRNRDMFVTKRCYYSHSNYAYAQIKKAKGQNKKVHGMEKHVNTAGIEKLKKALASGEVTSEWMTTMFNSSFFKYVSKDMNLPEQGIVDTCEWKYMNNYLDNPDISCMMKPRRNAYFNMVDMHEQHELMDMLKAYGSVPEKMPFRPVKLSSLEKYDVAAVEHMNNLYRLYNNGSGIKFLNDDIVCVSISKEREWKDFEGVVYFNSDGYRKDCSEWLSFFEWMANRNEDRWSTDWKKDMEFDAKNLLHVMRLMYESEHILKEGRPRIRWDSEKLKFLREIREGRHDYETVLKKAEEMMLELKESFENSTLPNNVNMKKVNEIYLEMIETNK